MHRLLAIAAVILGAGAGAGDAVADEVPPAPTAPRVIHAPTAWLQPSGQLHASAGASHRAGALAAVALGLGGVAEVDLDLTDRWSGCAPCTGDRAPLRLDATSALFKLGLATARRGPRPRAGVALGFRRTIGTRRVTAGERTARLDAAQLYLVGGGAWRGLEVHAGAELHAARHGDAGLLGSPRDRVRPLAGLAWTPAPYPRTALLVDVTWTPSVEPAEPALRWSIGWGVRYQALRWGSIELAVRNREAEALGDATVFVRVNGVLALGRPLGSGLD